MAALVFEAAGEIDDRRRGRPIARVVPEPRRRQEGIEAAIADLEALREEIVREHGSMSVEDILSSIHEGRKYRERLASEGGGKQ